MGHAMTTFLAVYHRDDHTVTFHHPADNGSPGDVISGVNAIPPWAHRVNLDDSLTGTGYTRVGRWTSTGDALTAPVDGPA